MSKWQLKNETVCTILAIGEEAVDERRLAILEKKVAQVLGLGRPDEPFPYMNERLATALRTSGPRAIRNGSTYALTDKGLRLYYALIDLLYDVKGREVVRKIKEVRNSERPCIMYDSMELAPASAPAAVAEPPLPAPYMPLYTPPPPPFYPVSTGPLAAGTVSLSQPVSSGYSCYIWGCFLSQNDPNRNAFLGQWVNGTTAYQQIVVMNGSGTINFIIVKAIDDKVPASPSTTVAVTMLNAASTDALYMAGSTTWAGAVR